MTHTFCDRCGTFIPQERNRCVYAGSGEMICPDCGRKDFVKVLQKSARVHDLADKCNISWADARETLEYIERG